MVFLRTHPLIGSIPPRRLIGEDPPMLYFLKLPTVPASLILPI